MKARTEVRGFVWTLKGLAVLGAFLLYPIICARYYRFMKQEGNHADASKFVKYGVLGTIGIAGYVSTFWMGMLSYTIVVGVPSLLLYCRGCGSMFKLIRQSRKVPV